MRNWQVTIEEGEHTPLHTTVTIDTRDKAILDGVERAVAEIWKRRRLAWSASAPTHGVGL